MRDGAHAALIKGGHGTGKVVTDLLATQLGFEVFEHERLNTKNTHGTGCTLASALAGKLANAVVAANSEDTPLDSKGRPDDAVLKTACEAALTYVRRAITNAPNIGGGNGPLGHGV
jgi:hydroxymethylpyrimidine/phosphomethylpyrimidine kinase